MFILLYMCFLSWNLFLCLIIIVTLIHEVNIGTFSMLCLYFAYFFILLSLEY